MTQETIQVSDQTSEASGIEEKPKKDSVAYDTYRKTVEAEKRAKAERDEYRTQLESIKHKELEAQGKHSEVIQTLREQLKTAEENKKNLEYNFYKSRVEDQIKHEALKMGCKQPDHLLKLIDKEELNTMQFDKEKLRINEQDLGFFLEKQKQSFNYLFDKAPTRVADATPSSKPDVKKENDLNKLSLAQLRAGLAIKLDKGR